MARRSLACMVLVGTITLGVGSLLWIVMNESVTIWMEQPGWQPEPGELETEELDGPVSSMHRSLSALWTFAPALIVLSVSVSALIIARR